MPAKKDGKSKRKAPVTINLPPRIKDLATAYAEANQRHLSELIEDLLRRELEAHGVPVGLPPEELAKILAERFKP